MLSPVVRQEKFLSVVSKLQQEWKEVKHRKKLPKTKRWKEIYQGVYNKNFTKLTWPLGSKYPENLLCGVAVSHIYPWEE